MFVEVSSPMEDWLTAERQIDDEIDRTPRSP
jgi:hypothetical protein